MASFDHAFNFTLKNEGGYTNHPLDHGGPTRWGITLADLAAWRKRPVHEQDVKNLTQNEAKEIYRANYWQKMGLDKVFNEGIATAIFDIGVVQGCYTAVRIAQATCNILGDNLSVDGINGPKTTAAINSKDPQKFIREFSLLVRARFDAIIKNNHSQKVFEAGWHNRADRLLTLVS